MKTHIKKELTRDDQPQIQIKAEHYEYSFYILQEGQILRWGPDNKYYSFGPGIVEFECSPQGGTKMLEADIYDMRAWSHINKLINIGYHELKNT